ncbi:MAG: cytochrome c [Verrucomicrobiota bacterium]|jgi:mono/diheme cytochrome c family protein
MIRILLSTALIGAALGAATVGILGVPGRLSRKPPVEVYSDKFFPGMDRQPKLRPQEPNSFFANGLSSQLPPAGTVARSEPIQTAGGPVYGFEDSPVNTGRLAGTTNFVETNPLPVDEALLQRGRERFDIYCAPCHGRLGDGNGVTKRLGVMPTVANLHDKRIVELTDGEIFNTVTRGKSTMGAYGPLMPAQDRWAVIAYLRALQLSWLGTKDDLPPAQQGMLK